MAIVREGYNEFRLATAPDRTTIDETETIESGTTLSILTIHIAANDSVSELPTWDAATANEDFTLIHDAVDGTNSGDSHTLIYGLINPTSGTKVLDYTLSPAVDGPAHVLVNYSGTVTTSVAAATNYLSEDINNGTTSTTVHASAGTSGATLFFAGSHVSASGKPASNASSFFEIADNNSFTSSSGNSFYVADKIGGAADAITVTWSQSNENTGILIEILPVVASNSPTGNLRGSLYGCLGGVI